MRKFTGFALLAFGLSILSCQDTREDAQTQQSLIEQYKNVGHQIPLQVGIRWMDTYNVKSSSGGRIAGTYSIDKDILETSRGSVPNFIGVAFHYGIDGAGVKHIIAIPVNESMSLWNPISGRIYVDANENAPVTQDVAYTWAQAYKAQNPNAIWFHYFGKNVFDEMTGISYFQNMEIIPATNDLDLTPQLLLVIEDPNLSNGGRTFSETTTVYDASYPCPRCPVQ
jgi:hypothetical protein